MKSGTSNIAIWKNEENNQIIGISLGWNFAAEHEWGIKDIEREFGISSEIKKRNVGIKRISVNKFPKNLKFIPGKQSFLGLYEYDFNDYKDSLFRMKDGSSSVWSWRGFIIKSENTEIREFLSELYISFKELDAVIFIGKSDNPFGNGGLILAIKHRIPKSFTDKMEEEDKGYLSLKNDFEKCGIEKRLRKSSKEWFALSPKRFLLNDKTSKYDFMVWLNPQDQHLNNSGWFTVEELDEWIDGKGPVPK